MPLRPPEPRLPRVKAVPVARATFWLTLLFGLTLGLPVLAAETCKVAGLALQVLGPGGPRPDDARASSGYVIWHDGRSRVLVDAGGGLFQSFGAAGARLEALDVIALTHLHTDHTPSLPALLKEGYFIDRR